MIETIKKYKNFIQGIIYKKTGKVNPDIEQEVYIKIWKNKEKYSEQGKEKSWIKTITVNTCIDYFKSKFYSQSKISAEIDENVYDNKPNPEQILNCCERQKFILKEVNALPKKLKQVIVLKEFEDYSLEDISKKLNVPVGTVKSRLFNAKKILAEKLSFLK